MNFPTINELYEILTKDCEFNRKRFDRFSHYIKINNAYSNDYEWVRLVPIYFRLSKNFIEKYFLEFKKYGAALESNQTLSLEYLEENFEKVNWENVLMFQNIPEACLDVLSRKYLSKSIFELDYDFLYDLLLYRNFSFEFLKEVIPRAEKHEYLMFNLLSTQKLPEDYIEFLIKRKNKGITNCISYFQLMSEKFIKDNLKFLDIHSFLSSNISKISEDFENYLFNKLGFNRYKKELHFSRHKRRFLRYYRNGYMKSIVQENFPFVDSIYRNHDPSSTFPISKSSKEVVKIIAYLDKNIVTSVRISGKEIKILKEIDLFSYNKYKF